MTAVHWSYRPIADRLAAKVRVDPSGCHIFMGHRDEKGYGRLKGEGTTRLVRAHRVSYEVHKGLIPPGLVIDHLCRVPACVNPDHLEAVTSRVNSMRGIGRAAINAARTHCPRGHEYTPENTRIRKCGRLCRLCARDERRSRRLANRDKENARKRELRALRQGTR